MSLIDYYAIAKTRATANSQTKDDLDRNLGSDNQIHPCAVMANNTQSHSHVAKIEEQKQEFYGTKQVCITWNFMGAPSGFLLGSIESELSEFPTSTRPSVEQFTVEHSNSPIRHHKLIKLTAAFVALALFLWFGSSALISAVMWLQAQTRSHSLFLACFFQFSIVAIWSVLCIPFPSSIEILSGFLFGFFWGSVVNVLGLFVTSSLSFLVGRRFLRDVARSWLLSNAPRLHTTFRVIEQRGVNFLIFFRFLTIPFWSKNYGPAALLDCGFRDFAVSVVVASCPFGVLYAYIGNIAGQGGTADRSHTVEVVVIGLCLVVSTYVSWVAVKIFQEAEASDSAGLSAGSSLAAASPAVACKGQPLDP